MSFVDRMCEAAVRHRMRRIVQGRLELQHAGAVHRFGSGGEPGATMVVEDAAFFRALTLRGHLGAAESFVRGEWSSPDLTAVIRLFARNRRALEALEKGWARLARPALALLRLWNRNTRRGSARNIRAHYDLGNDFFASFLDETMTYSCGIFADERTAMGDASIAKYDRICRKLELSPSDHVVEIGTGWGGFAIHAASTYGCRVTTTTISREQHDLARRRIAEARLDHLVTVLQRDYRDLEGRYDKLVSIEMIEAVGHQYLDTYFEKCADLLAPDGMAAIQAISQQDLWYDPRQRQVDFIKRYIFPGSFVPAISTMMESTGRTDLRLVHLEDLTPHYAETLRRWRSRYLENWGRISALGFDDRFRRLWEFYFCYCEGGFAEAVLGVSQLVFAKPLAKGELADPSRHLRVAAVA